MFYLIRIIEGRRGLKTHYEAVIFDMDGTLLDTLEDIGDTSNRVLQKRNYPQHPIEDYKNYVGNGARKLIEDILPDNARIESTIQQCLQDFLTEYEKSWNVKTQLYDGIAEMLDGLEKNDINLSILSNKPDSFAKAFASEYLNDWTFSHVLGNCDLFPRKPDPAGALYISKQIDISPEKILYVGDTLTDMKTAVGATMKPVGVLWGFRTRQELVDNGAQILLNTPTELLNYL